MMLYCYVSNHWAFRNFREQLQWLKLWRYCVNVGSRKVCCHTFKPRAAISEWEMAKKLMSSWALLIWSIYLFHHCIKFVTCILVYTQELWQLKMADVSVLTIPLCVVNPASQPSLQCPRSWIRFTDVERSWLRCWRAWGEGICSLAKSFFVQISGATRGDLNLYIYISTHTHPHICFPAINLPHQPRLFWKW